MAVDLHEWGLYQYIRKKSVYERFLIWIDRMNQHEIEKQRSEHIQLIPHLKTEEQKFRLNKNALFQRKHV